MKSAMKVPSSDQLSLKRVDGAMLEVSSLLFCRLSQSAIYAKRKEYEPLIKRDTFLNLL